ncbi:hypothetical protein D3C74_51150 [compost metagenome]
MTKTLEWDAVYEQYKNLVKYAAKNTYKSRGHVDNAVSIEDLFQLGMLKLFDCWERYKHLSMEEFKHVFSAALFRAVRRGARPNMTLDVEGAVEEQASAEDFTECLVTSEGLENLKSEINSPVALAILHELMDPSPRTLWEVWADKARKTKLKSQGKNVNAPKTNEVRMKHIRLALNITQKQFDLGIAEIREKAALSFGLI